MSSRCLFRKNFMILALAVLFVAMSCTKELRVTNVTLKPNEVTLLVGHSLVLEASVEPADAPNKTVKWSSDDGRIATVNSAGELTAIAPGTVKITVTTDDGGFKATCTVTVEKENSLVPVTGVTITCPEEILSVGKSLTLEVNIEPEGADNKNVTWSSDNDLVATVNSEGEVTAIAPGTVKITVTTDDGGFTATCTINVEEVTVTGLNLNRSFALLLVGRTMTLNATVEPEGADINTVTWNTDNDRIAAVNSEGEVTAVAPGTAKITATTDNGVSANCTVTVPTTGITMTVMGFGVRFLISAGAGNITVDWGDGELIKTNNATYGELVFSHRYSCTSAYNITITGNKIDSLDCSSTQFTNLDESSNIEQKNYALINYLTALDVSSNVELIKLNCSYNEIMSLDVSSNVNLRVLNCLRNLLTFLDVSHNTDLTYLECAYNQLTTLDISNNEKLSYLSCNFNQLESLDASNNVLLKTFSCSFNHLTFLNVSSCTELKILNCMYNQLTALDVSSSIALEYLYCNSNQLTASSLNDLFRTLHDNTTDENYIYIGGNPGESDCDVSIAEGKGWKMN